MKHDSHKREKKASETLTEIERKVMQEKLSTSANYFIVHGKYSLLHHTYHNFEGKESRSMASTHAVTSSFRTG